MITRSHFTRLADAHDVDAKTVERDYALTHVLTGIYHQPGSDRMAFKGGTALRLCYFEDYRYSADLDFSLTDGMTLVEAVALVRRTLEAVKADRGFTHLALNDEGTRIEYIGPLGGNRDVKLDLATGGLRASGVRVR